MLICGAYQLKAQQLFQVKPADSTSTFIDKYFKSLPNTWKPDLKLNETFASNNLKIEDFHSKMPIVVLEGNSKMPVVKLDGNSKMPVVPINPNKTFTPLTLKSPYLQVLPVQKN